MNQTNFYKENIKILFGKDENLNKSKFDSFGVEVTSIQLLPVNEREVFCSWQFSFERMVEISDYHKEKRAVVRIYNVGDKSFERKSLDLVLEFDSLEKVDSLYFNLNWQDGLYFAEVGFLGGDNNFYPVAGSNIIGKKINNQNSLEKFQTEETGSRPIIKKGNQSIERLDNTFVFQRFGESRRALSPITKECEDKYNEGNYSSHGR